MYRTPAVAPQLGARPLVGLPEQSRPSSPRTVVVMVTECGRARSLS